MGEEDAAGEPHLCQAKPREPDHAENRLWNALRARQLGGFKFRQQHEIGDVRPDFFCPAVGLIVEVDGDTHEAGEDALRDERLTSLGFTTLRFGNADVMQNLDGVCARILEVAQSLPPRVWGGGPVR